MKNKNTRGHLARCPLILPKGSSGYICWRSEFSLGFIHAMTCGDNLFRRVRWSRTETPRGSLVIQGGLLSNARNLVSLLLNMCWTIRKHQIPAQFKSRSRGKELLGQLSYGHLFRNSLIMRSYLLSTHCIPVPALSAFGNLTHLIPISMLWRGYFHFLQR